MLRQGEATLEPVLRKGEATAVGSPHVTAREWPLPAATEQHPSRNEDPEEQKKKKRRNFDVPLNCLKEFQ